MTDSLGQIIIILLLILANGFFSMAEISLLSVRRGRLEQLEEEGDKRARTALEVSSSHNRLLSTVQIGITLVAILTGAIGSAALGNTLAALLMQVEFLAPIARRAVDLPGGAGHHLPDFGDRGVDPKAVGVELP